MVTITNLSRRAEQNFVVGGTRDEPKIATLKPGETADINVDPKSPSVAGRVHAGVLSLKGATANRQVEGALAGEGESERGVRAQRK